MPEAPKTTTTPTDIGLTAFVGTFLVQAVIILGLGNLFTSREVSPAWFILALPLALAVGGLAALGAHRERLHKARRAAGWCVRCGYDLRATPGRCPECGKVPRPPRRR